MPWSFTWARAYALSPALFTPGALEARYLAVDVERPRGEGDTTGFGWGLAREPCDDAVRRFAGIFSDAADDANGLLTILDPLAEPPLTAAADVFGGGGVVRRIEQQRECSATQYILRKKKKEGG
jgi:hypothetical protein